MLHCDLHDYLEIACMYNYRVKLVFKTGATVEGKAMDVKLNDSRKECISMLVADALMLIVVTDLVSMQARDENPHFSLVKFV
jgi:Rho-binding antiterminator|tara:strand:- start:511 stop:756 length:246 start_codon:yes stop_codon:yes gene_type:complete